MDKQPVLLVVALQPEKLRWFVVAISHAGELTPLFRSEDGNLQPYVDAEPDQQVTFLRHRLAGVLQRGCDRLWPRQQKADQIVFLSDRHFEDDNPALTRRVADHFATWMLNPPVAFFMTTASWSDPHCRLDTHVGGTIAAEQQATLQEAFTALHAAVNDPDSWEVAPSRKQTEPST